MTKALAGHSPERLPCAPHWWGGYKYEALGLDIRQEQWKPGADLASVYSGFYEKFRPDWFHLHIGTPRYFQDAQVIRREGKDFLAIDPRFRALKSADRYFSANSGEDEEIVDFPDYLLGSRSFKPKIDLASEQAVREYAKRYIAMEAGLIRELGYTDHVRQIAGEYGEEVFIAVHLPSAVCEIFDPTTGYVGFEQGLLAFHDRPEGMRLLFEIAYELQLEWARAYASAGAHAFIISESYISPEIVGPEIYRRFLKPIHMEYFRQIERMGLIPICNFWGDAMPILEDLTEIGARALMVEESKKGFRLDIREIRERIGDRICLFGNLDSLELLHDGKPEEVQEEALRQAEGASRNFIIANGSPITPGTPESNVRALVETRIPA